MRHLTEEEIQTYLDGPSGEHDTGIVRHLRTCKQCREVLETYKALYDGLSADPAYAIPHDLAGSVLSALGLGKTERRLRVPGDVVLIACAIATMLVGLVAFADLRPLLDSLSAAFRPVVAYLGVHLESSHARLSENGGTPTILLTGFLILALTGLLDLAFRLRRLSGARRQIR
jgi:hypothetical protein